MGRFNSALWQGFSWRHCRQRQRMDTASKFILEKLVDETMAFDAGLAGKDFGHHKDAKVALAGAGRIAMTGVKLGLVDDVEPRRPQSDHQLFSKSACNGHLFLVR